MPFFRSWRHARVGFGATALALAGAACACFFPALMSALLRYMFTAPGHRPWNRGRLGLRLFNVGGLPVQALNSQKRLDELSVSDSRFDRRDGDVWVVSYVKSGTTWTIGILAALRGHSAAEYAGNLQRTTRTFCPQPELPDLGWGDDGFGHSLEELNAWPDPRCFKSHWPSRDHVGRNAKGKYIYVMRNAQDQMVSHWNQVWGMGFHYGTEGMTFEGGWDGFFEDWINGDVENGSWADHVASWWARRGDPNVLFLRYEELKANPRKAVSRIASFVGLDISEEDLTRVVNVTSFDVMRRADQEDKGLRFMRWLGVLRTTHIREGHTGKGKMFFSAKQLAMLEEEYKQKLKPLGVPREYMFSTP